MHFVRFFQSRLSRVPFCRKDNKFVKQNNFTNSKCVHRSHFGELVSCGYASWLQLLCQFYIWPWHGRTRRANQYILSCSRLGHREKHRNWFQVSLLNWLYDATLMWMLVTVHKVGEAFDRFENFESKWIGISREWEAFFLHQTKVRGPKCLELHVLSYFYP